VSLLDRVRGLLGRSSEPPEAPTPDDKRLDAASAAAMHDRTPTQPGGGLPPLGDVPDSDEDQPRT
jgi:hypothetical protein